MVRILLADDHPMVRQGIRTVLEAEPGWQVVAETADEVARNVFAHPTLSEGLHEAALALPEEVEGLEPTLAAPIPEPAPVTNAIRAYEHAVARHVGDDELHRAVAQAEDHGLQLPSFEDALRELAGEVGVTGVYPGGEQLACFVPTVPRCFERHFGVDAQRQPLLLAVKSVREPPPLAARRRNLKVQALFVRKFVRLVRHPPVGPNSRLGVTDRSVS